MEVKKAMWRVVIVISVILLLATACSSSEEATTEEATTEEATTEETTTEETTTEETTTEETTTEETTTTVGDSPSEPVVIGWSGPFTGPLQAMAETMESGIRLATDEVNAASDGRELVWVVKDDALSSNRAVAQALEFIGSDNVEIMVGPAVNTPFLPTRPYYNEAGVIQFLVGTAATGVDLVEFPNVYRTFFSGDAEAEMLIDYLADVKGAKSIAILVENTGSGLPGAASLQRAIHLRPDVTLATQQVFPAGESNLTQFIQAIKDSGAEAIALWSVGPPNTANVIKAVDELEFYVPIAGDIGALFKGTPVLVGDALDRVELYAGAFRSEVYSAGGEPSGLVLDLRDRIKSQLGIDEMVDSVHLAIMYYNTVYVISEAIRRAGGDTSVEALTLALEGDPFETPLGDVYDFSSSDHNGFVKANLTVARITTTSWNDGFWQQAEGAP